MEWFLIWLGSMIGSAMALYRHNKGGNGVLLGLIFGPIGLVIALIWRANLNQAQAARDAKQLQPDPHQLRDCPHCAEKILRKAKVCKHCGRDVEPLPTAIGSCPSCGKRGLPVDAAACPGCGMVFNGSVAKSPIPD